ncbi:MAG: segregation/condensation protein A [Actinomycetota bacterium]|nr:segregation/condensation protein A [Actinomycetota bacterium]
MDEGRAATALPPAPRHADSATADAPDGPGHGQFHVTLTNFEGPFDLLLSLISKHKLDVTEIALSQVTDEFISYLEAAGDSLDLGQATEFLVVAATLLDLKAARLLPSAEVEDEDDLAALEARDLLFARLLAYRAFREAAGFLRANEVDQSRRFAREVGLEPRFAQALPDVLLGVGVDAFAALAVTALQSREPVEVSTAHLHAPRVSVREHAGILRRRLAGGATTTFRTLTSDCSSTLEVVARFLALLDLHTRGSVSLEQLSALGELHVRWTASTDDSDTDAGLAWDDAVAVEAATSPDPTEQQLVRDDGKHPLPPEPD